MVKQVLQKPLGCSFSANRMSTQRTAACAHSTRLKTVYLGPKGVGKIERECTIATSLKQWIAKSLS